MNNLNESFMYCKTDIPDSDVEWIISNCRFVGVDTETSGLDPLRDKLNLIQIEANGNFYIIEYRNDNIPVNIIKLLQCRTLHKVFHHATFDVRFLMKNLQIYDIPNIICTKIASKLLYGINSDNSLKNLLSKILGININKDEQLSDWSSTLSKSQIEYAVNDVKYLVRLWESLEAKLIEQGLLDTSSSCFSYLPIYALLSNKGIDNIFQY